MAAITCPSGAFTTSAFFTPGSGGSSATTTYTYSCTSSTPSGQSMVMIGFQGGYAAVVQYSAPVTAGPSPNNPTITWSPPVVEQNDMANSLGVPTVLTIVAQVEQGRAISPGLFSYGLHPKLIFSSFTNTNGNSFIVSGTLTITFNGGSSPRAGLGNTVTLTLIDTLISNTNNIISYDSNPGQWRFSATDSNRNPLPPSAADLDPNSKYTLNASFNVLSAFTSVVGGA